MLTIISWASLGIAFICGEIAPQAKHTEIERALQGPGHHFADVCCRAISSDLVEIL
jgi:hypothetical protein